MSCKARSSEGQPLCKAGTTDLRSADGPVLCGAAILPQDASSLLPSRELPDVKVGVPVLFECVCVGL